jgi:thiol-disulfide isomerase/thioredoxin
MRSHSKWIGCLVALLLSPLLALADAALPRYDLPVGRKLVYTSSSESKNNEGGGGMTTSGSLQLTVVRENPDGSRRVILRSASSYAQKLGGGGGDGNEHKSPERVELAYADVFPDGRVLPNESLGMRMDTSTALPPLPKDAQELANGWKRSDDVKQETNTYAAAAGAGDSEFTFTAVQDGVMNKIYQTTRKSTYHLDRAKRMITRVEGEHSQGYGFQSKGTASTKLESDTMLSADEAKQLDQDFERFFAAREQYTKEMAKVEEDPTSADATMAQAKSALEKASGEVKSQDAKKALAKVLDNHDEYAKYAKESANRFKDVLNKPSPDWSTTDIDGKPAKLADFRGKVVVMDFWYRGCGWCMYAMPQVIQLSQDYKDKPVVVLGMNTDQKEEDARFVIDTFGLKYSTIKADGIPPKYGIQGFPTLVIVDQEGVVRDVHVGYSPDLREKVSKKIDELLGKSAKAGG